MVSRNGGGNEDDDLSVIAVEGAEAAYTKEGVGCNGILKNIYIYNLNSYLASSLESLVKTFYQRILVLCSKKSGIYCYYVQRKIVSLNKEAIVKVDLRFTTVQTQNSDHYTVISTVLFSQQKG